MSSKKAKKLKYKPKILSQSKSRKAKRQRLITHEIGWDDRFGSIKQDPSECKTFGDLVKDKEDTIAWLGQRSAEIHDSLPPYKDAPILHWVVDAVVDWWLAEEKLKKQELREALLKVSRDVVEKAKDIFVTAKARGRPINHNKRAVRSLQKAFSAVSEASQLLKVNNEGISKNDQYRRFNSLVNLIHMAIVNGQKSCTLAIKETENVENQRQSRKELDIKEREGIHHDIIEPATKKLASAKDIHIHFTWYDVTRNDKVEILLGKCKTKLDEMYTLMKHPRKDFLVSDEILNEQIQLYKTHANGVATFIDNAVEIILSLIKTQNNEIAERRKRNVDQRAKFNVLLESSQNKFKTLANVVDNLKNDSTGKVKLHKIIECHLAISKASSAISLAFRKLKTKSDCTDQIALDKILDSIETLTNNAIVYVDKAVALFETYDIDMLLSELSDIQNLLDKSKLGLANHPPLQPAIDASFGNCEKARESLIKLTKGIDVNREILRNQLSISKANVNRTKQEVIEFDQELKQKFRDRMQQFNDVRNKLLEESYNANRNKVDNLIRKTSKDTEKPWLGFTILGNDGSCSATYTPETEDFAGRHSKVTVDAVRCDLIAADSVLVVARQSLHKSRFLAYDNELVTAINEIELACKPVKDAVDAVEVTINDAVSHYEKESRTRIRCTIFVSVEKALQDARDNILSDEEFGLQVMALDSVIAVFKEAETQICQARIQLDKRVNCDSYEVARKGIVSIENKCLQAQSCVESARRESIKQQNRLIAEMEDRIQRCLEIRQKWRVKYIDPQAETMARILSTLEENLHGIGLVPSVLLASKHAQRYLKESQIKLADDAECDTSTEEALLMTLQSLETLTNNAVNSIKTLQKTLDEEMSNLTDQYESRRRLDINTREELRKSVLDPVLNQFQHIIKTYSIGSDGSWVVAQRLRKSEIIYMMEMVQRHKHPVATQQVELDGIPKMRIFSPADGDPVEMPPLRAVPAVAHAMVQIESACMHAATCIDVPVDLTNIEATSIQLKACKEICEHAKKRVHHLEAFVVGLDLSQDMATLKHLLHAIRINDFLDIPGYNKMQLGEKVFESINIAQTKMKEAMISITSPIVAPREMGGRRKNALNSLERSILEQQNLCNVTALARRATREAKVVFNRQCAALHAAFQARKLRDIEGRATIRREHTDTLQARIDTWMKTCREDAHGLEEVPVVKAELDKGQRQLDELLHLLSIPGDLTSAENIENMLSLRVQQADACVAQIDFMCQIAEVEHQRLLFEHGNTVYVNETQRKTIKFLMNKVSPMIENAAMSGYDILTYTDGIDIKSHNERIQVAYEYLREARQILATPVDLFKPRDVATAIDNMIKFTERAAAISVSVEKACKSRANEIRIALKEKIDNEEYVEKSIIALRSWEKLNQARSNLTRKLQPARQKLDQGLMILEDDRRLEGMPVIYGGKYGGRFFQLLPAVLEAARRASTEVLAAQKVVSLENAVAGASVELLQSNTRVISLITEYHSRVNAANATTDELLKLVKEEPRRMRKEHRAKLRALRKRKQEEAESKRKAKIDAMKYAARGIIFGRSIESLMADRDTRRSNARIQKETKEQLEYRAHFYAWLETSDANVKINEEIKKQRLSRRGTLIKQVEKDTKLSDSESDDEEYVYRRKQELLDVDGDGRVSVAEGFDVNWEQNEKYFHRQSLLKKKEKVTKEETFQDTIALLNYSETGEPASTQELLERYIRMKLIDNGAPIQLPRVIDLNVLTKFIDPFSHVKDILQNDTIKNAFAEISRTEARKAARLALEASMLSKDCQIIPNVSCDPSVLDTPSRLIPMLPGKIPLKPEPSQDLSSDTDSVIHPRLQTLNRWKSSGEKRWVFYHDQWRFAVVDKIYIGHIEKEQQTVALSQAAERCLLSLSAIKGKSKNDKKAMLKYVKEFSNIFDTPLTSSCLSIELVKEISRGEEIISFLSSKNLNQIQMEAAESDLKALYNCSSATTDEIAKQNADTCKILLKYAPTTSVDCMIYEEKEGESKAWLNFEDLYILIDEPIQYIEAYKHPFYAKYFEILPYLENDAADRVYPDPQKSIRNESAAAVIKIATSKSSTGSGANAAKLIAKNTPGDGTSKNISDQAMEWAEKNISNENKKMQMHNIMDDLHVISIETDSSEDFENDIVKNNLIDDDFVTINDLGTPSDIKLNDITFAAINDAETVAIEGGDMSSIAQKAWQSALKMNVRSETAILIAGVALGKLVKVLPRHLVSWLTGSSNIHEEHERESSLSWLRTEIKQRGITGGELKKLMDDSNDNIVDRGEFERGLRKAGLIFSEDSNPLYSYETLYKLFDTDGDGRITCREMIDAMCGERGLNAGASSSRQVFLQIDHACATHRLFIRRWKKFKLNKSEMKTNDDNKDEIKTNDDNKDEMKTNDDDKDETKTNDNNKETEIKDSIIND